MLVICSNAGVACVNISTLAGAKFSIRCWQFFQRVRVAYSALTSEARALLFTRNGAPRKTALKKHLEH